MTVLFKQLRPVVHLIKETIECSSPAPLPLKKSRYEEDFLPWVPEPRNLDERFYFYYFLALVPRVKTFQVLRERGKCGRTKEIFLFLHFSSPFMALVPS